MSNKDPFLGKSLMYMDPSEVNDDAMKARWVVQRPPTSTMRNLCGYRYNDAMRGFLVRDEMEAVMLSRRTGWRHAQIVDGDERRLRFEPTDKEIQSLPMITRPYGWLHQEAEGLVTGPGEIPPQPTRQQLIKFTEGKKEVQAAARGQVDLKQQVLDVLTDITNNMQPGDDPVQAVANFLANKGGD